MPRHLVLRAINSRWQAGSTLQVFFKLSQPDRSFAYKTYKGHLVRISVVDPQAWPRSPWGKLWKFSGAQQKRVVWIPLAQMPHAIPLPTSPESAHGKSSWKNPRNLKKVLWNLIPRHLDCLAAFNWKSYGRLLLRFHTVGCVGEVAVAVVIEQATDPIHCTGVDSKRLTENYNLYSPSI